MLNTLEINIWNTIHGIFVLYIDGQSNTNLCLHQYKYVIASLKLPLIYMGTTEIRTQNKNLNRSFIFLNQEK